MSNPVSDEPITVFAVNIAIHGIEQFARCVGQPHQPLNPFHRPSPFPTNSAEPITNPPVEFQ